MLYMAYVAHIVTAEAGALTPPEIAVTESDDRTGVEETIICYGLSSRARVADAVALLQANGWNLYGVRRYMEPGYWIMQLRVNDWGIVVEAVTGTRETAEIERQCREAAYRSVIGGAMRDQRTVKKVIAEIGGVSRERAYQIRDGRR